MSALRSAHRFDAIGAPWQVDTAEPLAAEVIRAINERIGEFDRTYSRFRDDSLVARIASTPGIHAFPDDAGPLFELYRALYEATDGAVSPLVGRALENLGYDRAYSLRPSAAAQPVPAWNDSFAWNGRELSTIRPVTLDVGAAGKGYLVDIVGAVLRDHGISDFVIDASGDLVHSGAGSLRIGLEHPLNPTKAIGIAEVSNGSLCASASNRRAWGDGLHHVIDALTGLPTRSVIATWAIAPTALLADGLATALFFTTPERLSAVCPFTYVRMYSTGRVDHSPDFEGDLFV
jgi:thiamine biosynthesis lipoprotein